MYNVMSPKAEEFISNEEILECLEYGEKNKANRPLIEEILEKASKMKGISHREAIVLLDCELEDLNQKIYGLAEKIKLELDILKALILACLTAIFGIFGYSVIKR